MKKVIVTGASGFIGRRLVLLLAQNGIEVIAVTRADKKDWNGPVRTVQCDLGSIAELPRLIQDRDVDTMFHLAWRGVMNVRNPEQQLFNLTATLSLLDAAEKMCIGSFVGAGSMNEPEAAWILEQDAPVTDPAFYYKVAKLSTHHLAKTRAGLAGIRFLWPVIINAYGPGEKNPRLITRLIQSLLAGQPFELSSGDQWYDFAYVDDVARAFMLLGEKGKDGTHYNIGSGNIRPLKEYLQQVQQLVAPQVPLLFGACPPPAVVLPEEVFSIDTLAADTGYAPLTSFEEGITATLAGLRAGACNCDGGN